MDFTGKQLQRGNDGALRVLIYSQDGLGLGHLRRNLSITLQLKRLCPDASVLIIADSPAAPFFELPPKCDFVKIPTIVKVDYGVWRSNRLNIDSLDIFPVRSEVIKNVALSFQPHIFLVDHMPQGAHGELARPLKMIRRYSPHTRMMLGLRDILGGPEDICRQWRKENAYAIMETYYDQVLIYGCRDIFDAALAYRFPPAVLAKCRYCGYVAREDDAGEFANRAIRKYLPKAEERLVLVTGGGGHDASRFMDVFLDTIRHLQDEIPLIAIISTGPFMKPEFVDLLRQKARGLPVTIATLGGDVVHFMKRSDLVISMAGYNTFGEILRFRKNAIIIPRSGPSAEQTMRTDLFRSRALFSDLHPANLRVETLSSLVRERLTRGGPMHEEQIPDLNGAQNAAAAMLEGASMSRVG